MMMVTVFQLSSILSVPFLLLSCEYYFCLVHYCMIYFPLSSRTYTKLKKKFLTSHPLSCLQIRHTW